MTFFVIYSISRTKTIKFPKKYLFYNLNKSIIIYAPGLTRFNQNDETFHLTIWQARLGIHRSRACAGAVGVRATRSMRARDVITAPAIDRSSAAPA